MKVVTHIEAVIVSRISLCRLKVHARDDKDARVRCPQVEHLHNTVVAPTE